MNQALTPSAKAVLHSYLAGVAEYYGGVVGEKYTATPAIEQVLMGKMVESANWFMPYITMPMVVGMTGEKVLMSLSGATGSRTDTSGSGKRVAKNFANLENRGYELKAFNNDFKIMFSQLNAWAAQGDKFAQFYQSLLLQSIANSIIMSGWHGVTAAADTDIATYPLLQDLSIGWLQRIRAFNSGSQWVKGRSLSCTFTDTGDVVTAAAHGLENGQVVKFTTITTTTGITANTDYYVVGKTTDTFQVSATSGGSALALTSNGSGVILAPITIGSTGYENLDVTISNAKNMIDPWLRGNLVAYVSDNLVAREEGKYYVNTVDRASEKLVIAQNGGVILQSFGGLRCIVPPFFPDDTILIAPVGELQFYTETGSVRRHIMEWHEEDCIKDFNQRVAGHVVYNEESCFLIENLDYL